MHLEYKYLIPVSLFLEIKHEMLPFIELDLYANNGKNNQYTVRSIYFDDFQYKYYFEKIEGIKIRKKLRIRAYDDYTEEKIVFLEIKRKNDNYVYKNRAKIFFCDIEKFIISRDTESYILFSNGNKATDNADKFLYYLNHETLRPTMLVTYDREPYYYKFDKCLRITFDKNLRCLSFPDFNDLFNEKDLEPAYNNNLIIEIKFEKALPFWLQNIITRYSLQRKALSKYTICLDADRRKNPANRYKNFVSSNYAYNSSLLINTKTNA